MPDLRDMYNPKGRGSKYQDPKTGIWISENKARAIAGLESVEKKPKPKISDSIRDKFVSDKGIRTPTYQANDRGIGGFYFYDDEEETYRAGEFAKIETGKAITDNQKNGLKGYATKMIPRMNKAMHFYQQKRGITPQQAYVQSREWQGKYRNRKADIFDGLVSKEMKKMLDDNNNLHGPDGKFISEEKARGIAEEKAKKEMKGNLSEIARYVDGTYDLHPSP